MCDRPAATEDGKGCPRCGGKVFEAEKVRLIPDICKFFYTDKEKDLKFYT